MITKVFVRFDKFLCETPLAFLLLVEGEECWFPKRLCCNFILNKKLGGNMVIPSWLYREKFGCEPIQEDAAVIIEHHIPDHKEPISSKPDANLIR